MSVHISQVSDVYVGYRNVGPIISLALLNHISSVLKMLFPARKNFKGVVSGPIEIL